MQEPQEMRRGLFSNADASGRLDLCPMRELPYVTVDSGTRSHTPLLRFFYLALAVLIVGVVALTANMFQLLAMHRDDSSGSRYAVKEAGSAMRSDADSDAVSVPTSRSATRPVAWLHGHNMHTGFLENVGVVFRRLGFDVLVNGSADWNVMWSHDYPFREFPEVLHALKPHQKVNHFPGSGYVTNKVSLAMSDSPYIPMSFRLPDDASELMEEAEESPSKLYVLKDNKHRGIKVQNLTSLNRTQSGTFVQEFVQNPLLIDGRKFDVGVYAIITSIDPLRVYAYYGDVLLRFCSVDYLPFNPENVDKYVVGDNYTPIWEMPSLRQYYEIAGYTMKESLNGYLRSKGGNPDVIWIQIEDAIRDILLDKEPLMISVLRKYKSTRNFFEMIRFDFVLNENLEVYIMEANMSPNLSSAHFRKNTLLYEQVIFNTLSVVGLAHWLHPRHANQSVDTMTVSDKDITVFSETCVSATCRKLCHVQRCRLCGHCLTADWIQELKTAFQEHMSRHNCRRVFPPHSLRRSENGTFVYNIKRPLSNSNLLMMAWFEGKCVQDSTWC